MGIVLTRIGGNGSFMKHGSNQSEAENGSVLGSKMETRERELFKTQQREIVRE